MYQFTFIKFIADVADSLTCTLRLGGWICIKMWDFTVLRKTHLGKCIKYQFNSTSGTSCNQTIMSEPNINFPNSVFIDRSCSLFIPLWSLNRINQRTDEAQKWKTLTKHKRKEPWGQKKLYYCHFNWRVQHHKSRQHWAVKAILGPQQLKPQIHILK